MHCTVAAGVNDDVHAKPRSPTQIAYMAGLRASIACQCNE